MNRLDVFNIHDIFKLQLHTFMYRYSYGLLPKSLNVSFELRLNIHNYNTGNCAKLNLKYCRTTSRQASISYLGPNLWNSLADSVKESISFTIF
jgi:hypothetical protein